MSGLEELDAQGRPKKRTVVLIHGTFAAPDPKKGVQWYEPGSAFCQQLDQRLEAAGSQARCWAHLGDAASPTNAVFTWSGENTWVARVDGARKLERYLAKLIEAGWLCHIVAHSHGGNVVIEALQLRGDIGGSVFYHPIETWRHGQIVLLGTPIMDLFPRKLTGEVTDRERIHRGNPYVSVPLALLLMIAAYAAGTAYAGPLAWPDSLYGLLFLLPALVIGALISAPLILMKVFDIAAVLNSGNIRTVDACMLLLKSRHDEAWLLLSQASRRKRAPAILDPPPLRGVLRSLVQAAYLRDRQRFSRVSLSEAVAVLAATVLLPAAAFALRLAYPSILAEIAFHVLLTAWASFLVFQAATHARSIIAALLVPWRLVAVVAFFVGALAAALASRLMNVVVRPLAWRLLRATLLGTGYYPGRPPTVVTRPPGESSHFWYDEELPDAVVHDVTAARADDAASRLTAALALVAAQNPDAAADGTSDLDMARLLTDVTLVHAAYYRHPWCIDRIAGWIELPRAERQRLGAPEEPY